MKFHVRFNLADRIWLCAMFAAALILFIFTRYPIWILPAFTGAFFLIRNLEIHAWEKVPWLWNGLILGGASILSTYTIQHLILDPEYFRLTNHHMLRLNMLACGMLYLIAFLITCSGRLSFIIVHSFLIFMGLVDYFVYFFRQNEFSFADLQSIGTGLSVSGTYHAKLLPKDAEAILLALLLYTFVWKLKAVYRKKWLARVIAAVLLLLTGTYVYQKTVDIPMQTWEQKGSYQNGYVLNFMMGIRDTVFVKEPDGYSEKKVEKLKEAYEEKAESQNGQKENSSASAAAGGVLTSLSVSSSSGTEQKITDASGSAGNNGTASGSTESTSPVKDSSVKNPTVIAIMNESFADLGVVGSFTTNEEVTPFLDSMKKNTLKGYTLSSVFGAKTPNSEWEFLTGNTMGFLPSGSVAYQQYIGKKPYSLVSELKSRGYHTVAMHPYLSTGWSRNQVYPRMGFDETHFVDDFDQTQLIRGYISDQELYNKMIQKFEEKKTDENLFLFGVTMQNHGGYKTSYPNFQENVYPVGADYADVRQYLSLIRESDNALKNLITYFENVDEPVEIIFFGDHQPSLNNNFYRQLNGKGLSGLTMDELENLYKVPFFIWTNYDTTAEEMEMTSNNYLSTMALERGNFELPLYNVFLKDLQEKIPAINSRGYYSLSQGHFLHIEDAQGEEKKWLQDYHYLQYNSMFDKKGRDTEFFPYPEQSDDQ